ncbi:MAG: nitronate monooxygenase [Candidatus Paceibacterota bacterium]|jgi:enoyl-[acyl-carrier protein] reductase II
MFQDNKLTKLLGIKYPIIQGGMAGISESGLVSAVSNAGGLGTIGAGLMPAAWVEQEIKKTRQMTDKPFAVNLFMQNPNVEDIIKAIISNKTPIVFIGGGNPSPVMPYLKRAGIKTIPVVPSPRLAKKMEDNGADAVVVEGIESGGHVGPNTTFCLVPQTKKLIQNIPLIAAGGIYDGHTSAVAMLAGADGVQLGTRFLAAPECIVSESYKQKIIEASADDIEVVLAFTGHPLRIIKNKWSEDMKKLEAKNIFPEELRAEKIAGSLGGVNVDNIPLLAGLSAAGIKEIRTCKDIVEEIASYLEKHEQNIFASL